jgi:predicted aspartyl protease
MVIYRDLPFEGSKSAETLRALFDSGATLSCIRPDLAEKIGRLDELKRPLKLQTADKENDIEIKYKILLEFYIDEFRLSDEFIVVPNLSEEAIIGATTMQKWRMKLNFEQDTIEVSPLAKNIILK